MTEFQSLLKQNVSQCRTLEELDGFDTGVVYKAADTRIHRLVALKFLPNEMAKDVQPTQPAPTVNHLSICAVREIGEENHPSLARLGES